MGSISRGPQQGNNFAFQIDPSLDRDNWAELSRTRPDAFLQTLVSGLAAPNPVSGAGPSVEEAFKSHLVSLAPNTKSTPSIPSLYSILKTFWLPSSPVYFSLTASASTARTPSEYRFLYWDPQPLVFNGIACPACSAPLVNRGRISSGPIKIYDLGKPFFIIGCEYICKSVHCTAMTSPEGRKFASTDSSILRALPAKLKDEFPALLMQGTADLGSGSDIWNWHGMGVSLALWNMVKASLRAGLTKEAIMDIIAAIQLGVVEDVFDRGRNDSVEEEEEDHEMEEVEGDLVSPASCGSSDAHSKSYAFASRILQTNLTKRGMPIVALSAQISRLSKLRRDLLSVFNQVYDHHYPHYNHLLLLLLFKMQPPAPIKKLSTTTHQLPWCLLPLRPSILLLPIVRVRMLRISTRILTTLHNSQLRLRCTSTTGRRTA